MKQTLLRWYDSDVAHSFRTSPVAIIAALIAAVCVFCSIFAGWVAPHNPFDLSTLELSDARFRLGADNYLTVLDAQRSLYAAQQGEIALQLAEQVNRVTLYKVLGGQWAGG